MKDMTKRSGEQMPLLPNLDDFGSQPPLSLDGAASSAPGQPALRANAPAGNGRNGANPNNVDAGDRAFHDWYRFVLSYPPHLVRDYCHEFDLAPHDVVLDPFCGTGTTIVEAKLNQFGAIGVEANPFAHFASSVKVNWGLAPEALLRGAREVASAARGALARQGISDNQVMGGQRSAQLRQLSPEAERLLIRDSISPLPLHKVLVLLDSIRLHDGAAYHDHLLLALGKALVATIGNLRFGPEVGVGKLKDDVPVISSWMTQIERMAADLHLVYGKDYPPARVALADARDVSNVVEPTSIGAVITSPPYPNEKDYTRTTRLESVLLGFYDSMPELRSYKKTLLRSNTRGIYKEDDDDRWVADHAEIQRIAHEIEQRRIRMNKNSGFERLYPKLTLLYFGGMARHFAQLRSALKPGAHLAYVVGDQASYLQVLIRTGDLLAQIAATLGYQHVRTDLFRTRFATATQQELREEVVLLRWPG